MKKYWVLLVLLFSLTPSLQAEGEISTFHRLLIFNSDQELLVVKIKGTDFWVTPGLYQDEKTLIREGLAELAGTYGITVSNPKLRGLFSLKDSKNQTLSTRLVYAAQMKSGKPTLPDNIEAMSWLPVEEAIELLTFPHIQLMVEQVTQHPKTVWGGSIERFKEGEQFKAKRLEEFYSLFER